MFRPETTELRDGFTRESKKEVQKASKARDAAIRRAGNEQEKREIARAETKRRRDLGLL
jgi:hypothetical protein